MKEAHNVNTTIFEMKAIHDNDSFESANLSLIAPNHGKERYIIALICLIIGFVSLTRGNAAVSGNITFEDFMTSKITINYAEFEIDTVIPGSGQTQTRVLRVKADADSYYLESDLNSVIDGKFHDLYWEMQKAPPALTFYDASINEFGTWNEPSTHYELGADGQQKGPGFETSSVQRNNKLQLGYFLNLGIPALDKDSGVTWNKQEQKLASKIVDWPLIRSGTRGAPCEILLSYKNGVPVTAVVVVGNPGKEIATIEYKYDKEFYDGRFPFEYSRFHKDHDKKNKEWTLRIKELNMSSNSLSSTEADPHEIFKSVRYDIQFWSNNVGYYIGARGNVRKSLTPQQAAAMTQARHHQDNSLRYRFWRIAIICILVVPTLCLAWMAWQKRKKT